MNMEILFEQYWFTRADRELKYDAARAAWMAGYNEALEHARICCRYQCYYQNEECPVVKGLVAPMPCLHCGEGE